jgi:hypothetical protein
MTARKTLATTALALAFVPALTVPAGASTRASTRAGARDPSPLHLYISAPYQDNGVTVVSLWWTAPPGATTYSLTADENTGLGAYSYTATGLAQFGPSNPFIVQVEGSTALFSATFQVSDNLGQMSNTVTYP